MKFTKISNKQTTSRQQADNNKQECIKNEKNEKNVFSEKIELEFLKFMQEQKGTLSAERENKLREQLRDYSSGDEDIMIKIIYQAIAGGYSAFRPLPGQKVLDTVNLENEKYRTKL